MSRYLSAFLLGTLLTIPVTAIRADEHEEHHDRDHARRYYDPDRHDWHEWNERETRAYRRWREERREREFRDFANARREEQREYWRWRHEHPDTVLWPR